MEGPSQTTAAFKVNEPTRETYYVTYRICEKSCFKHWRSTSYARV